jgi:hypothetical protein
MSRFRIACVLAALWIAGALHAAGLEFKQELAAGDSKAGDQFGAAVAVGDGVAAVGAYLADVDGKDSGAVYLFRKGTDGHWARSQRIGGAAGEWLGFDVAIDRGGQWLILGAPGPGRGPGTVYLYELVDGTAELRDTFSDPEARNGEIGSSVAIDGGWVAAGARGADQRAGRVYLLKIEGEKLTSQKMLAAPQPRAGTELGQSVSLREGMLAAGAPLPGSDGKSKGAAYASRLQGQSWTDLQPLLVPDGLAAGAAFGYAVAVLKDGAVAVGAPLAGGQAGAVYLYPGASLPGAGRDQLGVAMAADGDSILVGARGRDRSSGAAYLLNQSGSIVQTLSPSPPQKPGDQLGFSLAIRGDVAVVGSFGKGVASVFEPPVPQVSTVKVKLAAPAEVAEGAGSVTVKAVVTVTGRPLAEDLVVQVAASTTGPDQAVAGSDYTAISRSLTFAKSLLGTQEQPVSIPILDDAVPEPDETFTVTLSAPGLTVEGSPLKIKIKDDECVGLSLPASLSLVEGEPGTRFNVSLPRQPAADVTLHFDLAGDVSVTAQPEEAFYAADRWDRSRTVNVAAEDDALCNETPRAFTITVTAESADPLFACIEQIIPGSVANDGDPCLAAEARASVCSDDADTVLFEVEIENTGGATLENLAGPEILQQLPDEVTVVTASADWGVATVDHVANEFAWNGAIPVGETATIQILASLEPGVAPGDIVDFGGTYRFEGDTEDFAATFIAGDADTCPAPE